MTTSLALVSTLGTPETPGWKMSPLVSHLTSMTQPVEQTRA
jgi:hypothetical protein